MKVTLKDNSKIYYEVFGEGQPLVMVHGNGEDHTIFTKACLVLEKRYKVYLLDSPGHGQSDPLENMSYHFLANKIYEFMEVLNIENPYFYGFSDGGIIGLLISIKHPDYFKKLIISGANTNPKGLKFLTLASMKLQYFLKLDKKLKMMIVEPNISNKQLQSIKTNTIILVGENDLIKESHTKNIKEMIPNSILEIIPKENHDSYIINSDKIAYVLLKYLDAN